MTAPPSTDSVRQYWHDASIPEPTTGAGLFRALRARVAQREVVGPTNSESSGSE